MACMSLTDPEFWTEETYTINQVVSEIPLPQLVKVSEGFYGKEEVESFSLGDLLTLHSVKTVSKVVASFIELKESAIMKEEMECRKLVGEIMIPIGYKGKLKVIQCHKNKVYHSVEELTEQFPRYVKTNGYIAVNAADHLVELPVGTKLELVRILPEQGLVCKYNDEDILLRLSDDIEFSLLPDDNVYILKEIIGRFPLPQYIEFMESNFQKTLFTDLEEAMHNFKDVTGQLKLERIIKQDIIIGYYKPVSNDDKALSFCHRTIAVIPVDCEELQGITVQLPRVKDENIYETIGVRKFTNETMNVVEEGLYLEFKKVPKVHFLQEAETSLDCPPPIPPKPFMFKEDPKKPPGARRKVMCPPEDTDYLPMESKEQKPTTTASTNTYTDNQSKLIGEVDLFTSCFEEGHETKHHKKSAGKGSRKDASRRENEQEPPIRYPLYYDSDDDNYDTVQTGSLHGYGELTKSKSKSLKFSRSFKLKKFKKKLPEIHFATLRKAKTLVENKAKTFVENIFSSDITKELDSLSISPTASCTASKKCDSLVSPTISKKSNLTYTGDTEDDDLYEEIATHKMTNIGKVSPERPVVHIQHQSREDLRFIRPFRSYNTEETEEILKKCQGLDDFASFCKKENLNGDFIARLEDKDLREEPFNLDTLQVKKIQQLIGGWRP